MKKFTITDIAAMVFMIGRNADSMLMTNVSEEERELIIECMSLIEFSIAENTSLITTLPGNCFSI